MKTCGECRFWEGHEGIDEGCEGQAEGFFGCTRIPAVKGNGAASLPAGEKAYTWDGECYCSGLSCRSDFGCVLWEAKNKQLFPLTFWYNRA